MEENCRNYANQPKVNAGVLDGRIDKEPICKILMLLIFRLLHLLTYRYLPGVNQSTVVIRHGGKLLYAFSEATVPKLIS